MILHLNTFLSFSLSVIISWNPLPIVIFFFPALSLSTHLLTSQNSIFKLWARCLRFHSVCITIVIVYLHLFALEFLVLFSSSFNRPNLGNASSLFFLDRNYVSDEQRENIAFSKKPKLVCPTWYYSYSHTYDKTTYVHYKLKWIHEYSYQTDWHGYCALTRWKLLFAVADASLERERERERMVVEWVANEAKRLDGLHFSVSVSLYHPRSWRKPKFIVYSKTQDFTHLVSNRSCSTTIKLQLFDGRRRRRDETITWLFTTLWWSVSVDCCSTQVMSRWILKHVVYRRKQVIGTWSGFAK